MAKKPTSKKRNGAPTKYKPVYNEQAYKLTLLGYTDKDLAEFWGVTEQTINNWKKDKNGKKSSFFESIKKGKDLADSEIAASLYHRAKGYSHEDTKFFCHEGIVIAEPTIKHYPPDTAAAFIWLKNRQPRLWTEKKEIEHKVVKTDFDKLVEIAEKEGLNVEDYARREGINLDDYR